MTRPHSRQAQDADQVSMTDIRRKLHTAWQANEYAEVIRLLAPVEPLLTDLEREKLKFARRLTLA